MGGVARFGRAAAVAVALVACATSGTAEPSGPPPTPPPEVSSSTDLPVLRDLAPDGVLIGAAVAGGRHHRSAGYPDPFPSDQPYRDLLAGEFSSLTPENRLKWEAVHPERDRYDFAAADAIVDFAQANGLEVGGHTPLWSSQNPGWLRDGDFSDDELRDILRDHITTVVGNYETTVVGNYEGRIEAWDVANEVLDRSGELRTGGNAFRERLGTDAVADAFRWAYEAGPDAVLYLNDFGLESGGRKVDACRSITLWGLPDRYSWVPSTFPDEGAATPFADDFTPQPAFGAIADALRAG